MAVKVRAQMWKAHAHPATLITPAGSAPHRGGLIALEAPMVRILLRVQVRSQLVMHYKIAGE